MSYGKALTELPTAALRQLLSAVHKGTLSCPVDHRSLLAAGLPALVDRVEHLQGLDARSVQAVLVAVIAERNAIEKREARG